MSPQQLPLPVELREEATLDNYLTLPAARVLVSTLRSQCEVGGEPLIYLHGAGATGKSHLLQAACHLAGSRSIYLPLQDLQAYSPAAVMADVERAGLVSIDDVPAVLARREWEEGVFHLVNRARQSGCRLLLAGDAAPRELAITLADLRSRLAGGVVFQLPVPEDEDKAAILRFRAARRGLELGPEAARYIVERAPRGLDRLLELLSRLDRASLAAQRNLTVPFIRASMGW